MGDETKDKEALRGNTEPLKGPLKESSADQIEATSESAQVPSRTEALREIRQRRGTSGSKQRSFEKRAKARQSKRRKDH